jgi:hypothetical protein
MQFGNALLGVQLWARGIAILIMFFTMASLVGQTAPNSVSATGQSVATAPVYSSFATTIKKSVVYLQADCLQEDGKTISYSATAFFVMKSDDRLEKNKGFGYLVTNRHAAQPGIEHGTPCHVSNYWIRVNLRGALPTDLPQASSVALGPNVPWIFPDDPAVDLAIVPFAPDQSKVDYVPIPSTSFATSDVMKASNIGEGDTVIFTGLFVQMPGLLRLEPIVRQGTIAMIPTEPIMTTLNKPGTLYLADVHVFGGNSGSPMFVNLGGARNGGLMVGSSYKLLGVVSGYEFEDTDFNLQAATTYSGTVGANSGVTSVVPAGELDKLINSPLLQAKRDADVARMIKK